ncbi:MAG: 4Fe-4S binding protein [Methanosarcinaceae archaeon]|jgi:4Fe-4S ferredoxin|nr:4Fe-4S binding protein [Methanosarcinaceae archaeon]NKQ39405.1 4Fe-4S binding protein [Methanosarcinales archaeon]
MSKLYELITHNSKCHGCGNCVVSCPVNANNDPNVSGGKGPESDDVIMRVENGTVKILRMDLCGGCGTCIEACPVYAIELKVNY